MMTISSNGGQRMIDAEHKMLCADVLLQHCPDDEALKLHFEKCREEMMAAALAVVSELHRDGFRPGREGD